MPELLGAVTQEIDNYAAGVETSTSLGSTTNSYLKETWSYAWTLGYGTANSVETITYPNTLSGGSAPTATITQDSAGNIVKVVNALGDTATSAYNDTDPSTSPSSSKLSRGIVERAF